jgi:predicted pyridoxine 5'-phosphate oxidase superfamily flavin-nucleotide-binding protein
MSQQTFHEGERAVQARVGAGVLEKLAEIGPRVIRDVMPDQHRQFFEQLPFVLVGSVDAQGQPWASVLAAAPGFIRSPDAHTLELKVQPLAGDPFQGSLQDGASIALLGIEPHTRRRNRMNGKVQCVTDAGFVVHVEQSFGNCPKYIQAREPAYSSVERGQPVIVEGSQLDVAARRLIECADTLFIATSYAGKDAGRAGGVDVSHRGGKPGFVRVDGDGTLTMPDFIGNFFFNTLGNIAVHPRSGLLFIDFASGDLLYLAVTASIVWEGSELESFKGAQRLLLLKVQSMRLVKSSLPLRWGKADLSPVLAATGAWA